MKLLFLLALLTTLTNALMNNDVEDCSVVNPIGNTIVTAGDKMKIMWAKSHATVFPRIYLIQSDGLVNPIVLAKNVDTSLGHIEAQLPRTLVPSNAYYLILGEAPQSCQSGNLRVLGASSTIPDPKTPDTLADQISAGRFPKGVNEATTSSLPIFHMTMATITIALIFILF